PSPLQSKAAPQGRERSSRRMRCSRQRGSQRTPRKKAATDRTRNSSSKENLFGGALTSAGQLRILAQFSAGPPTSAFGGRSTSCQAHGRCRRPPSAAFLFTIVFSKRFSIRETSKSHPS